MSEKRMFSKAITESDDFLDLPISSQALYFHLSMNADDEGFINNSKRVARFCGAKDEDLKVLEEQGFLIFVDGVFIVKHWKINNKIRSDRKKETNYPEIKSKLKEKINGVYTLETTIEKKENGKDNQDTTTVQESKSDSSFYNQIDFENKIESIENQEEQEKIKTENSYENEILYLQEIQMDKGKEFSEIIFDVLFTNDLPCCNGNLITFTMRDFRLAMESIKDLNLSNNDVYQAVLNYVKIIALKRQGVSWWNTEQTFYHFCEKKTILKFLPENFNIEEFYSREKNKKPPINNIEDKIEL